MDRRGSHIVRYLRAERLHVDAHNGWTQAAQRNVGQGWARSPLASIAINCTPNASVQPFSTSKNSLIRALQIRATYRLCGALFMVGQGARKDALDLIENMRCTYIWYPVLLFGVTSSLETSRSPVRSQDQSFHSRPISKLFFIESTSSANPKLSTVTMEDDSWESRAFNKLGNDILDQVVSEVDPIDPMAIRLLGDDTREKREERMKKLTENMKLTTTRYGYGDYSWNSVS